MRILLIDTSKRFMGLVRRAIAATDNTVEVSEYDFEQAGPLQPGFDWSVYDVVIVDAHLGGDRLGLEFLERHSKSLDFPPTIVLAEQNDAYLAVDAMKRGAADYLLRSDVEAERLRTVLSELTDSSASDDTVLNPKQGSFEELLQAGVIIGEEYEYVRLIGHGGMSRIYLVKKVSSSDLVIIKCIEPHLLREQDMRDRFMREAEIAMAMDSPYVVGIEDYGLGEDYGMIVMEFFANGDLKQRMETGLTPEAACEHLIEIALGVDAIGEAGVVHRDLKPGNIMFRNDGSLAIADFGIAKRLQLNREATTVGYVLGTPHYFSPEQAQGLTVDTRSDLYSVGVILYEMLCDQKPYNASSIPGLVYQHVHADLPQLPRDLGDFQPILNRLLAKDPSKRFRCGHELAEALLKVG